jgi:hypothetical protein
MELRMARRNIRAALFIYAMYVLSPQPIALVSQAWAQTPPRSGIQLEQAGPPAILFNSKADGCNSEYISDASARAFRRADGQTEIFATHRNNWYLVGPSLLSARPSCKPAMVSEKFKNERLGEVWIEATYTKDGKHIAAITSQDLSQYTPFPDCANTRGSGHCWLNKLSSAISSDMGETFTPSASANQVIAQTTNVYESFFKKREGYFTVSNIASDGTYFYFMSFAETNSQPTGGNCVFRTRNPMDPTSWRAWDGTNFTIDARFGVTPREKMCSFVGVGKLASEVRSISYLPTQKIWIGSFLGRMQLPGDNQPIPGIYMSTSPDLVHWSQPSRVFATPLRPKDGANIIVGYPSIIDPGSKSINYDTIDTENPTLFFVRINKGHPNGNLDRDLIYVPLRLKAD